MGRKKKHTTIYDSLQNSGVLKNGTQQELDDARKEYWKEYRKHYARNKRQEVKTFTISFTQKEYKHIKSASEEHHSCTDFIKTSALKSAIGKHPLISPHQFASLIETLTLTYSLIQSLEDEDKFSPSQIEHLYRSLEIQEHMIKQAFDGH